MSSKPLRILQITWIIVGIICIAGSIRSVLINDTPRVFIFLAMAIISFLFAWIRHIQQKRS
jgi:hypothetical protein